MNNYMMNLPDLQPEEMAGIKIAIAEMSEEQRQNFFALYSSKRKRPTDILLFTCLGFVVVAGIQRLVLGQIGMGLLYLFTGGLCLVGTIIDTINYKKLTTDYNLNMMFESSRMATS